MIYTTVAQVAQTLPPLVPGFGGMALTAVQVLATLTSFQNEANPATRTPYSKFAQQSSPSQAAQQQQQPKTTTVATATTTPVPNEKVMVPSETGMTIIYAPALVVSSLLSFGNLGSFVPFLPHSSPAGMLCAIHFAKRVLEVKLLHKYSGSMERSVGIVIGSYYALIALLVCSVAMKQPSQDSLRIGIALFAIGLLGNFYHHYLLATLRNLKGSSNSGAATKPSKKYMVPKGGLFNYVAAPHYLFELVGWLGMAIVAGHGNAYLVFASMCSYLGGRSVAQNRWNRQTFGPTEWSCDKKNLLPFLF